MHENSSGGKRQTLQLSTRPKEKGCREWLLLGGVLNLSIERINAGVRQKAQALKGAKQDAEKVESADPAPKGAIENVALTVCLKAYPDTNREFFNKLQTPR